MMSNGVSPRSSVFLNNHAISSATTIPNRYIASIVSPGSRMNPNTRRSGMQAPISNV